MNELKLELKHVIIKAANLDDVEPGEIPLGAELVDLSANRQASALYLTLYISN